MKFARLLLTPGTAGLSRCAANLYAYTSFFFVNCLNLKPWEKVATYCLLSLACSIRQARSIEASNPFYIKCGRTGL